MTTNARRRCPTRSGTMAPPESRISADLWLDLRQWMLENDPDAPRMLEWSDQQVGMPETPGEMASEIIWIILCAGRSAQAARTIERKVWAAINAGTPVVEAFGYRAKAAAIERAWRERENDFALLTAIDVKESAKLLAWCRSIPFIGDDTQFQLAKNFGCDVVKPDIWLCRLAGIPDRPRRPVAVRFPACMALCRPLAQASGDRIASVDSLLWLACNKGVLEVSPNADPITIGRMRGASIFPGSTNSGRRKHEDGKGR